MFDIEISAPDGARSLAAIGRALGAVGIGLEGGGLWSGVAHYLVADGVRAAEVLRGVGLGPVSVREVLVVDLDVDAPGALGRMMQRLARAGIVLHGQYSDHDNRKVLLVDDVAVARRALEAAS
jgi:hypothetical protein